MSDLIEEKVLAVPGDWKSQAGDTLATILTALKGAAMRSDLLDPEVIQALTQAFTQLSDANSQASLIEAKLTGGKVVPLKTGT